jgi:ferrous iron transport protein A
LTPGTEFTLIRHAPLGDLEIEVRGVNLSLRRHEANVLCIEEVDEVD